VIAIYPVSANTYLAEVAHARIGGSMIDDSDRAA
jgi:hypothetical protein